MTQQFSFPPAATKVADNAKLCTYQLYLAEHGASLIAVAGFVGGHEYERFTSRLICEVRNAWRWSSAFSSRFEKLHRLLSLEYADIVDHPSWVCAAEFDPQDPRVDEVCHHVEKLADLAAA
ncbi:hypothetical protein [Phaeovulum sp.]|uniref:hypothetical protein n=1 Tax=Phaeovulum sp. TaxID=2934796 RepID=UPI0039E6D865